MSKKRVINLVLLFFSLISLSTNFWFYQNLKQTFVALYQTSLNPLGLDKYRHQQEIKSINKPRVVFLGDSRAYQWKSPQNSDFQFINRGISGQTSAQILLRFSYHVLPLKAQIIVLQLGANDLRMLPEKNQTREDIVANCQQNIKQIIEEAEQINATVILTTVFPLSRDRIPWEYRPFWANRTDMEQDINGVNQYIKTLSDRAIIFDTYGVLMERDPNKTKYYRDLLHLNPQGYQILNQELEKILSKINTKSKI